MSLAGQSYRAISDRKHRLALFVAVDSGPREALEPIARGWGAALETELSDKVDFWSKKLATAQVTLVVTGTSESEWGKSVEAAVRMAARWVKASLAAVEDYPGNYAFVDGGNADLLLVESDAAAGLARRRLGGHCPNLLVLSPARFDFMRARRETNRQATRRSWSSGGGAQGPSSLLWVGQPETEDALFTLDILLPFVLSGGHRLLFRAHPRDEGYSRGAYDGLARVLGSLFMDVTKISSSEVFVLAPRLLLTQFSSMVVEAGFHGIPSLCLLFPGAGMDRLLTKKGYAIPLSCDGGGIAACVNRADLPMLLSRLLKDEHAREELLIRFDAYFHTGAFTAPLTLKSLEILAGERK